MSLFKNETGHWEIPGDGELYSGDCVEFFMDGQWVNSRVDYRPQVGYTLRVNSGLTYLMNEKMELRAVDLMCE